MKKQVEVSEINSCNTGRLTDTRERYLTEQGLETGVQAVGKREHPLKNLEVPFHKLLVFSNSI